MPSCSILIPAHNAAPYIVQAVDSALSQTHADIEVIVVNDGSTDETAEQLQPFRDRIIYLEQPNLGPAAARNRALERASGDYVALLDGDDLWVPNRIELMLEFLKSHHEVTFATSDAYIIYDERVSEDTYYGRLPSRRRFRSKNQGYWILRYNFVHVMALIPRGLFERHGAFSESVGWGVEDWELWIRFLTGGETVGLVNQPLGFYRMRESGLSQNWEEQTVKAIHLLEHVRSIREEIPTPGLSGTLDLMKGAQALVSGDLDKAQRFFRDAGSDTGLPLTNRLQASAAALFPGVARKILRQRLRQ